MTTEIYPYCHSLSLHDALPIYPRQDAAERGIGERAEATDQEESVDLPALGHEGISDQASRRAREADDCGAPQSSRSEEHTSEVQSLMRISYAVFCLKKNQYSVGNTTQTKNDYTQRQYTI